MLNNVVLEGRLVKDPETKTLTGGKKVSKFTLAVQRNKEVADFIPCEAWDKTAESIQEYVKKGSLISVVGSIRVENYTTDAGNRTFTKVVVNRVHFIDIKGKNNSSGGTVEVEPSDFEDDYSLFTQSQDYHL